MYIHPWKPFVNYGCRLLRQFGDRQALLEFPSERFAQRVRGLWSCAHWRAFPERRPRTPRSTLLQPYLTTIHTRWDAGCHTGAAILRDISAQGYTGGRSTFNTYITGLRQATGVPPKKRTTAACQTAQDAQWRPPSARSLAAVVLRRAEKRTADDTTVLTTLQTLTGPVATAITLTQDFAALVRTPDVAALAPWLERAQQSELRSFLGFVKGIRRDSGRCPSQLD